MNEINVVTPIITIREAEMELCLKLEGCNITGSVKDRAAMFALRSLWEKGEISHGTIVIESSSGNFGIALAAGCKKYGIKFICVVDPDIQEENLQILKLLGAQIETVTEPDAHGGYLLCRLQKVFSLQKEYADSYWMNQYGNPLIWKAYYETLGAEICVQMNQLDYLFLGVSSGGTITGVSRKVKENFPSCKVIAVDVEGSAVFGQTRKKRHISGIGSSIIPENIKNAKIDEVVIVNEMQAVKGCRALLEKHGLLCGGSAGAVYAGIKQYFSQNSKSKNAKALAVFADRGERYLDTIYNRKWVLQEIKQGGTE